MNSKIRKATLADAADLIKIKNLLPLTKTDGTKTTGGFLLGTNLETYQKYITESLCLVAVVNNNIVGFGIAFDDAQLRSSDMWFRKNEATWFVDVQTYENSKNCYIEQLAFLPGYKRLVIQLAYNLAQWCFVHLQHQYMFTTTVREPILNLAAIPFIQIVNGLHAGNINEFYPIIGRINSDIYIMEKVVFFEQAKKSTLYNYVQNNLITF